MSRFFAILLLPVCLILSACDEGLDVPEQQESQQQERNEPRIWPPSENGQIITLVDGDDVFRTNILVIFDDSSSMRDASCTGNERKITVAREATYEFVREVPPDVNVGVVTLNHLNQFSGFSSGDRTGLLNLIESFSADGGTPLRSSLGHGYNILTDQARIQRGYGQYHLVVVTDGESGDGDPGEIARRIVQFSPIQVHAVGFCLSGHSLNDPNYVKYHTANSPEELLRALASVTEAETEYYDAASFK